MTRLTRDGTAEPVSRDQNLRRERGQGMFIFPVQLTMCRNGNFTSVDPFPCNMMCDYTHNMNSNCIFVIQVVI